MKRTIYKYSLKIKDHQKVEMPQGAKILTAQMQGPVLCVWALVLVDPAPISHSRYFAIFGTGNPVLDEPLHYIATVQDGPMVWHVFERE